MSAEEGGSGTPFSFRVDLRDTTGFFLEGRGGEGVSGLAGAEADLGGHTQVRLSVWARTRCRIGWRGRDGLPARPAAAVQRVWSEEESKSKERISSESGVETRGRAGGRSASRLVLSPGPGTSLLTSDSSIAAQHVGLQQ